MWNLCGKFLGCGESIKEFLALGFRGSGSECRKTFYSNQLQSNWQNCTDRFNTTSEGHTTKRPWQYTSRVFSPAFGCCSFHTLYIYSRYNHKYRRGLSYPSVFIFIYSVFEVTSVFEAAKKTDSGTEAKTEGLITLATVLYSLRDYTPPICWSTKKKFWENFFYF